MKTRKSSFRVSLFNKYIITCLAFVVWIVFLDGKYNFFKQHRLSQKVDKMEKQKDDLSKELELAIVEYDELMSDQEKYAREKYFISKEGEDVFIIEPTE